HDDVQRRPGSVRVANRIRHSEDAAVSAGDQGTVVSLTKREDIALAEAGVDLPPRQAGVARDEDAAEFLIVYDAGVKRIGIAVIHHQSRDLAMGEAAVRSGEAFGPVHAAEHAATVGSEQY